MQITQTRYTEENAGISPLHFLLSQQYIVDKRDNAKNDSQRFGAFVGEDGSFTFIWKIEAINDSMLSDKDKRNIALMFAYSILQKLPDDCYPQFLRVSSRNIINELSGFYTPHPDVPLAKTILDAIIGKQINATKDPEGFFEDIDEKMIAQALEKQKAEEDASFTKQDLNYDFDLDFDEPEEHTSTLQSQSFKGKHPLKIDRLFVVTWKPKLEFREKLRQVIAHSAGAFFPDSKEARDKEYQERINIFDKFKSTILLLNEELLNLNFNVSTIQGNHLCQLMYFFLNPITAYERKKPRYTPGMTVLQYLKEESGTHPASTIGSKAAISALDLRPDGINVTDPKTNSTYYYRASSVPSFDNARIDADFLANQLFNHPQGSIDGEGILAINFRSLSKMALDFKISARTQLLHLKRKFKSEQGQKAVDKQLAELEYVSEKTHRDNAFFEKAFDVSMHYVAGSFNEQKALQRVSTFASRISNTPFIEEYEGGKVILRSLPGNYRKSSDESIKRSLPFMSESISHLLPFYGSYMGVADPVLLFNNKDGEVVFVSPFGDHVGQVGHSLVVGGTGSGKTFTFAYILTSMIAKMNPKIWIIDKGESYKPICDILGGSYMKMSLDENDPNKDIVGFNIFRVFKARNPDTNELEPVKPGKDDIEFVCNAIRELYLTRSQKDDMDGIQTQLIEDSVTKYFNEKPIDQAGRFSEWAKIISNESMSHVNGSDIAFTLKTYYEGTQKALFEAPESIDWDDDLIVIETGSSSAKSAPVLLGLMLQSISDYIATKLPDDRPKIVAIDEAWEIMQNPRTVAIIAMFFRTMRKHLCAVFLISQAIKDFVKIVEMDNSGNGDGIVDNTAHYYLLHTAQSSYEEARKKLGFSDDEIKLWKSARAIRPYYSEIFYRYQFDGAPVSGIIRLAATPVQYWLSTTKGKERVYRSEMIKKRIQKSNETKQEATAKVVELLAQKYPWGLQNAA